MEEYRGIASSLCVNVPRCASLFLGIRSTWAHVEEQWHPWRSISTLWAGSFIRATALTQSYVKGLCQWNVMLVTVVDTACAVWNAMSMASWVVISPLSTKRKSQEHHVLKKIRFFSIKRTIFFFFAFLIKLWTFFERAHPKTLRYQLSLKSEQNCANGIMWNCIAMWFLAMPL